MKRRTRKNAFENYAIVIKTHFCFKSSNLAPQMGGRYHHHLYLTNVSELFLPSVILEDVSSVISNKKFPCQRTSDSSFLKKLLSRFAKVISNRTNISTNGYHTRIT